MSKKGVIVAAANLFAVGSLIAMTELRADGGLDDSGRLCAEIVVVGALPSLVGGALLGWLAAHLTAKRTTVLVGIALATIAPVAVLTEARWFVPAAVPTVISMLALERWTRRAADAPPPVRPVTWGGHLAIAMLAAIAIVVGLIRQHELELLDPGGPYPPSYGYPGFQLALGLFVGGAPFAALGGALLGILAGWFAKAPRIARYAMLGAPVVAIVAEIGHAAERHDLVLPALVPAVLAVVVLENVTRWRHAIAAARVIPRCYR